MNLLLYYFYIKNQQSEATLPPTTLSSVLTLWPWPIRQNELALATSGPAANRPWAGRLLLWAACTRHWRINIIDAWRRHENMSPWNGSWESTNSDRIVSWASYQIRKIAGCACAGNAGNVFTCRRLQRKPVVGDPCMHHGTCVTHVPWYVSGSLTRGGGENVPDIPSARAPAILRIW